MELIYEGSKGGDKEPHQPVETPNNLLSVAYAKVLLAVAEGELAGTPTGRDIYLNGTPLLDAEGNSNFGGVTWDWRPGTQDQTHIQGMPDVSNEITVGVELRNTTPWVREITKESLDAVRVTFQWPALMKQQSNGDTVGYTIDYAIDIATDGGPYVEYKKYQVSGKTNTDYERTTRVGLPPASSGWTLRVRRITPNSQDSLIQDTMNIKSYAEVSDVKQRYPNTALLFVQFDSRLFGGGQIPKISVKTKGRLVRVPTNYNPTTRAYSGIWDGSFKWAYTNNPAWVFFDIVTQNRFGLGSRVKLDQVDKWELYEVAQYCDVLVDDGTGAGTKEPRHTCNMYIQTQTDAWSVLRDIGSIFNGMTYWDGNKFIARADKQEPLDNIPTFSRSSVINGEFNYQTTDERTIFTSALVSYDEPADHYGTQVEAVWEKSQIQRWGGDRQTTLAAIGCTSRGEAQRKGKYTLLTNMFNRSVSFRTGLQGLDEKVRPGAIIGVADPLIAGKEFTGRLMAATLKVVTLDRITEAKAGDKLFITRKDGSQEARTIQAVADKVVTLTTNYSEIPQANSVWYLESEDLKSQLFKIVKLKFDGSTVDINAVEYNDSKFAAIDNGARLEPRPISKVPPQAQKAPTPVIISSNTFVEQMQAVTTMTISWPQTTNAVLYEGQWRVGSGDWVTLGTTGATQFNVKGIYTGQYLARVRAINALGVKSSWTLSVATDLNGKVGLPPALVSLEVEPLVFGMRPNWKFPSGVEDTARTELFSSVTPQFANATKQGDFAYPQESVELNGLKAGATLYFWARLIDKSGNVGPWYPSETGVGVQGLSSTDVDAYEEYFKDQINNSALGQELAERVDLIDGPAALPGSVNQRVEEVKDQVDQVNTEVNDRIDATNQLVTEVDGRVDTINQQVGALNLELDQQVASLNQSITQVNNDLQTQIDAIDMSNTLPYDSTLTYTKDQVVQGVPDRKLYQAKGPVPINTAPPNTTYWLDIGQAVISADGLAARVTKTETDITEIDGELVAQANRIDGVQAALTGKASVQAVDSLTTRVTATENAVTAQGQAITGLTSTVNNKADASAVTALTTRVTATENAIVSQSQSITSLNNNLTVTNGNVTAAASAAQAASDLAGGKGEVIYSASAPATAKRLPQNLWIDITGNANTPKRWNGSAWVVVTDKVATDAAAAAANALALVVTKADASAVTALTSTVTQQGDLITAQGTQITTINTTLDNISGNGSNLVPAEYSVFNVTPPVFVAGSITASTVVDNTAFTGYALKLNKSTGTGTVYFAPSATYSGANIALKNKKYIVSFYARSTVGQNITTSLRTITSAGVARFSTAAVVNITSEGWTRYSAVLDVTSSLYVGDKMCLTINPANGTPDLGVDVYIDRVMLEEQVGVGVNPSSFAVGNSVYQNSATASAIQSLDARVTQAEGTITSQGTAITSLNNSLTVTNQNVTTAQNAAQAASDLAGGKGKVLTQSATPATADRLPQNLWIDTTGNANTPKRWNGTAWVAVTDKVATDAAAAAASALSQVATKAEASALTALTTRVTNAEGTITSQGSSITSLNNSLTTTNNNVTAAQNAANAANTLAGGKGEVIYGSSTPTVAQRLTQNLWIDTTSNNNTPKRWNGSAWVVVTDKVATDAAAAAANALAQVATKADASALTALNSTVTQQGDTITAQGNQLTSLNASISSLSTENIVLDPTYNTGKSALGNHAAVTIVANTAVDVPAKSPGPRLAKLVVAGTAANTYVAWGSVPELDYPGSSIVGNISVAEGEVYQISVDVHQVANTARQFGLYSLGTNSSNVNVAQGWIPGSISSVKDQWVTITGEYVVPATCVQFRPAIRVSAGAEDSVLYISNQRWVKKTAQDAATATAVTDLTARVTTAEGNITTNSTSITSLTGSLTTTNQNVTAAQNAANAANTLAGGKGKVLVQTATPAAADQLAQNLWIDMTGGANTPKRWTGSTWSAVTDKVATDAAAAAANALSQVATKADASTVTALSNTVTQQGNTITAQGNSITTIKATVDSIGGSGSNLNPSEYSVFGATLPPLGAISTGLTADVVADAATLGAYALKFTSSSTSTTLACYLHASNTVAAVGSYPISYVNGKYIVSFYAKSNVAGRQIRAWLRALNATDVAINATSSLFTLTETWTRYSAIVDLSNATTFSGNRMVFALQPNTSGVAGTEVYLDRIMVEKQVGASSEPSVFDAGSSYTSTSAQGSAISSLTSRVTEAEGTITSQGTSITSLNNSLTTTNQNVTAAQNAANAANTLAGGKGKVIVQNAAPAVEDRLAQNLWIDTTGGANTPKRWSGSAWLAVTDKVATDAATAASNALAQVATKAESSTVTALSNTVTQQGTTITAQGNSLTSIQASVNALGASGVNLLPAEYSVYNTTTPKFGGSNFTTSSVADAAALRGYALKIDFTSTSTVTTAFFAKGFNGPDANMSMKPQKYIISYYAKASEDGHVIALYLRTFLADNVTILNSGGAKQQALTTGWVRYWYVVDVSNASFTGNQMILAVQPNRSGVANRTVWLDRVMVEPVTGSQTEPSVFSAGPSSDQSSANANAISALDARVTSTEGSITSQASQITTLTIGLAGKADASALNSLSATVTQQGNTITSQGTAVTQLQNTVGGIGGNGSNLIDSTYSWLGSTTLPQMTSSPIATTITSIALAGSLSGFSYRVVRPAGANPWIMFTKSNNAAGWNIAMTKGKYLMSFYANTSGAGMASGVSINTAIWDGGSKSPKTQVLTSTRTRYTQVIDIAADSTVGSMVMFMPTGNEGDVIWIDSIMLEKQIGANETASPFTSGPTGNEVTGQATAISTLDTKVTNVEGTVTAQATRLDGIYVQVNPVQAGDITGYAGSTGSLVGVWSEQSARIEDGVATGQKIDTVQAQVEDTTNSLNKTSATVQQTSTAVAALDGRVSASWSVKLQVNSQGQYVAAGVGLGIENGEAGLQSTFLVSADKFAVVNGVNGVESTPFVVNSGQVFIKDAFIANGSITMLKIGDTLQSDNFVAGIQGWRLTKSGQFEINGHVPGQGTMVMTNRSLRVYDGNNVKRVQLGDLSE